MFDLVPKWVRFAQMGKIQEFMKTWYSKAESGNMGLGSKGENKEGWQVFLYIIIVRNMKKVKYSHDPNKRGWWMI